MAASIHGSSSTVKVGIRHELARADVGRACGMLAGSPSSFSSFFPSSRSFGHTVQGWSVGFGQCVNGMSVRCVEERSGGSEVPQGLHRLTCSAVACAARQGTSQETRVWLPHEATANPTNFQGPQVSLRSQGLKS